MSYGQQEQQHHYGRRSYYAGGRAATDDQQRRRFAQPQATPKTETSHAQSLPPLAPLPPDPPSRTSYTHLDARLAHQNTSSSYSNHRRSAAAGYSSSSSAVRYRQNSASLSRPPPPLQQHNKDNHNRSPAAAVSFAPVLSPDRPRLPSLEYASGTAKELPPLPAPPSYRQSSYIHDDPRQPQQHRIRAPSYDSGNPEERARQLGYSNSIRTNSTTTPGADNLGETAAGGGIAGIAYGVASANERDSGVRALQAIQDQTGDTDVPFGGYLPPDQRGAGGAKGVEGGGKAKRSSMDSSREDNPYIPEPRGYRGRDSRPPMAALGAVRGAGLGGMAAAQAERQYAVGHSNALAPAPAPAGYQLEDPFGSRASLAPSLPDDAYAGGIPSHRRSLPPPPSPPSPPKEPHSYVPYTPYAPLESPPRRHFPAATAATGAAAGGALGAGLGAAGAAEATAPHSTAPLGTYLDNPLQRRSQLWDNDMQNFDPNDIEDDGDDGLQAPAQGRRSVLSFTGNRSHSGLAAPAAGAAGAGAGAGIGAALGGLASRNASGKYNPVSTTEVGGPEDPEKSEWLKGQTRGRKRLAWIIGGVVLVLAIIGGVVGGVLGSRAHQNQASSSSSQDLDKDGELDANSASIKKLMNNPNLHRVFPGVAYTPLNAQYPECLSNMPSQNNVTKDVAVLSQMTNTIRLYGTDCNQTEMVIEAVQKLNLKDMKIWLAVWLNNNDTTNTRGINAMHDILAKYGTDPFDGVILGNEVLYRKDLSASQLSDIITQTRSNFTQNKISLPIAVADLGDNWTNNQQLAADVDVVMSNVHPFFGGVPVDQAAGWAWDFWQEHDVKITGASKKNVISEIGWPSAGGQDCGSDTAPCDSPGQGAVAGIDEMNKFMDSFVCQSLQNGTNYFWFEAFDEPWKVQFNTPGKEWEDKWGLMDANRNLKSGLKIPSCPGQSIPSSSAK